MSNLEPRVSATMSSSTCSLHEDFCCHAATQSHSIIPRSIKRCGYPGRHESCLSFRSRLFFPPLFCLCCLPTPRPRTHSASPVSYATPSSPLCLCSVSFAPPPSPVLSPPVSPSSDDVGSQYQGKSLHCVTFPLSFIFLLQAYVFLRRAD